MLLIAGIAGGATMVLPGVSGSYLLLVLGQYLVILSAISTLKDGLSGGGDLGDAGAILLPVAIGAVIGVVGVSNLMEWFLRNCRTTTLGVLLGFLLGAVLGLWPFYAPVSPELLISEYGFTAEAVDSLKPRDWKVARFTPSLLHVIGAVGLVMAGFAISLAISMIGREPDSPSEARRTPLSPR